MIIVVQDGQLLDLSTNKLFQVLLMQQLSGPTRFAAFLTGVSMFSLSRHLMSHGSQYLQDKTELLQTKPIGVSGMRTVPQSTRLLARCRFYREDSQGKFGHGTGLLFLLSGASGASNRMC